MDHFILSLLVKNEAGVLTRISGLFARRGYNINSLSVGESERDGLSRITIAACGDERTKEQIMLRLLNLHDVVKLECMDLKHTVIRELLLIKLNVSQGSRSAVMEAVDIFRAKVVDLTPESFTLEITGEQSKCEAFLEYLKPFGIAEVCRTGVTAIGRGAKVL